MLLTPESVVCSLALTVTSGSASVNCRSYRGFTPLHLACMRRKDMDGLFVGMMLYRCVHAETELAFWSI